MLPEHVVHQQESLVQEMSQLLWPTLQMPPSLAQSLFRLTSEDLKILATKIRQYGLDSRIDAIKNVLDGQPKFNG